jgi:tartrate-resistant acid phosphatase type 5
MDDKSMISRKKGRVYLCSITTLLISITLVCLNFQQAKSQSVRFAVIGDFGGGSANETSVANQVKSWNPSFVATVGDNRYGTINFDLAVGRDYCPFLKNAGSGTNCNGNGATINSYFPSLGNHDYTDGGGLSEYLSYFTLPGAGVQTSGTSGNERYYDVIQGQVHLFILDSQGALTNSSDMTAQKNWLQAQLAASTAVWKIVVDHHAPYSSCSTHGSVAAMQWPYQTWGADAMFSGHDHTYERVVLNGFPYFVTGNSGYTLYNFGTPVSGSEARYNTTYGAVRVDASRHSMVFTAINMNGVTVDTYTLNKNIPPSFSSDPLVKLNGQAGAPYTGTIAGDASDADSDPLTFSKTSGPSWLSVATDGTLSGTPGSGDAGLNSFNIQVADGYGGTDQAAININVSNEVTVFNQIGPLCQYSAPPDLPVFSNNSTPVKGSWSPPIINTFTSGSSIYTFIPYPGQNGQGTTMTITINPATVPLFAQVGPYAAGTAIDPLPVISTNNITGTWSPVINNLGTTTYTFIPNASQCSTKTWQTITIVNN